MLEYVGRILILKEKIMGEKLKHIFKLKYMHIAIIILGTIFIALSIFHTNMWFDESYTIGIVRHSFSEIWNITSFDVHPPFYYFCLHILLMILIFHLSS